MASKNTICLCSDSTVVDAAKVLTPCASRRPSLSIADAPVSADNRGMSYDQASRRRASARKPIVELARPGIDPPRLNNAIDFLTLSDPSGEEDELPVEIADWLDRPYAEAEAREYEARALIERARGTPPPKARRDKYAAIRALKLPPEQEKKAIVVANKLTAMLLENRRHRRQPQSPGGPVSGRANL